MISPTVIAAAIFLLTYAIIVSDRIHKTLAALLGAAVMILFGVINQHEAFAAIDLNVIFLLAGMMIIANTTGRTGIFSWLAVKAAKLGRGEPVIILVVLSLLTAVISAFLDNVTTVVLIVPVALLIAEHLLIDPKPFLISLVLASNIGGTATLIGDPPNILIGSAAGLGFDAFLANLAPVAAIILVLYLVAAYFVFRNSLQVPSQRKAEIMVIDESEMIHNMPLLRKSGVILALTLAGFLLQGVLHTEVATIALIGATLLLIWSRRSPAEAFEEVEWPTLFFFVGLFILVEGLVKVGILQGVASGALAITGADLTLSTTMVLWLSAFASGIVDNIPYTAAMIPVVQELGKEVPVQPLWWSLALGACLGGNATLVGASANIIVAHQASKAGYPISFGGFLRYGLPVTFGSVLVANAYVWVRYLM